LPLFGEERLEDFPPAEERLTGGGRQRVADLVPDRTQRIAKSGNHPTNNNHGGRGDDAVLHRGHALEVVPQVVERILGPNEKLKHVVVSFIKAKQQRLASLLRTSQPLIGKTCHQLGSNIFQIYSSRNSLDADFERGFSS
jgi:hypothetical protein